MNKSKVFYYKGLMKDLLKSLPNEYQLTFKIMYSHNDLNKDINLIIDELDKDKINWALTQIKNSCRKLNLL